LIINNKDFSMLFSPIHRRISFSFFLVLLAGPPAFAKGSEKLATQLLEASGINAVYAQGIAAGYRKSAAAANRPAAEADCFAAKVTPQLTMPAMANGYATEFSDPELQAGIAFFESKSGRKYAQHQRLAAGAMFGIASQEKEPDFTARDLELINAFLETRLGKLILATNTPMSATAKAALQPRLAAIRDQCAK
jgi:hypothetical protein